MLFERRDRPRSARLLSAIEELARLWGEPRTLREVAESARRVEERAVELEALIASRSERGELRRALEALRRRSAERLIEEMRARASSRRLRLLPRDEEVARFLAEERPELAELYDDSPWEACERISVETGYAPIVVAWSLRLLDELGLR
ncbi:MAG: hypothetical protein QXU52_00395 [Fervidicoccaceae archaeon]